MYIKQGQHASNNHITIKKYSFNNNKAVYSGGLYLDI